MSIPLLEMVDVTTRVRMGRSAVPVVRELTLQVGRGEAVGLVGESGSGKSMTARTIMRLLPAGGEAVGTVRFDGTDVLNLSAPDLRSFRSRQVALIPQDPRSSMNPLWTCGDSLREILRHAGLKGPPVSHRARELLRDVEIGDIERVLHSYPGQLSGGMLQRVMIAIALATEPQLLIADEPTTALDVTIQAEILGLLARLRTEASLSLLFISHDLDVAARLCDQVMVMYGGRIVERQSADRLFREPRHPYTAGLLGARPDIAKRSARLAAIPGTPPAPDALPQGCSFHPRCRFATDACRSSEPALRRLGSTDAFAACIRAEALEGKLVSTDADGQPPG